MDVEELEEGNRILFNERKLPLKVIEAGKEAVVEGPQGGRYVIYRENEELLVSREGNKRYSSYCRDLRSVGHWEKRENVWRHSKTGAKIYLKELESGFWTIDTEGLQNTLETPKYGYSDEESAQKDAEKMIKNNPEGK